MSKTRVPAIPAPTDSNLRDVARAVKGVLDVREGLIGDPLDANITFRELVDGGVIQVTSAGNRVTGVTSTAGSGSSGGYNPVEDLSPPPAPTGFTATGLFASVQLEWAAIPSTYINHAYTEVWRSDTNVIGNAVLIGTSDSRFYVDYLGNNVTRFYWIRFVSQADVKGPYNATSGTEVATAQNPGLLLNSLTTAITSGQLATSLGDRINLIDGADTLPGSVNARVKTVNDIAVLKNRTYVSASAPTSPTYSLVAGDLWVDSDDSNKLHRWTGSEWTAVTDTRIGALVTDLQTEVTSRTNGDLAETRKREALYAASFAGTGNNYKYFVQAAQPTGTQIGDIWSWVDPADAAVTFRRYNGSTWVDSASNKRAAIYKGASSSPPSTDLVIGDLYLDTDDQLVYVYNGATWSQKTSNLPEVAAYVGAESLARVSGDGALATSINTVQARLANAEGVFSETWEDANALSRWELSSGTTDYSIVSVSDAETGAKILRAGNNSGNDQVWIVHKELLPFDDTKLYRIKVRARRTQGAGTLYAGWVGVAQDGVTLVNTSGLNQASSGHYHAASAVSPTASWFEYTGYTKGFGGSVGSGGAGTIAIPGTMHPNVRYLRPVLVLNFSAQTGITEVDSFIVDDVTDVSAADARITTVETAKIGYCTISGAATDHTTKQTCEAAGGTWNVGLPIATAVKQVSISDGSTSAALEQRFTAQKTTNDGLLAQYSIKVDVAGHVSGFGLSSTLNTATPFSEFGVRADRFWIAPPSVSSSTAPSSNLYKGYVWRDTSVTPNVTRYWSGSAWTTTPQALPFVVVAGETGTINGVTVGPGVYINTAFIADATITNAKIGNAAIDDAKIASLSAAKITAGTLDVARLGANSITADRIRVTSKGGLTIISEDPMFGDSTLWTTTTNISFLTGDTTTGGKGGTYVASSVGTDRQVTSARRFEIDPTKIYRLSANLYRATGSDRNIYLFLQFYDGAGTYLGNAGWGGSKSGYTFGGLPTPIGEWVRCGNSFGTGTARLIPATARFCEIGVWFNYSGNGSTTAEQRCQDLRLDEYINAGQLIVDGSVTATQINSNGLTIRDSAGNIILNAGTSKFVGDVTGTVDGAAASLVRANAANGASAWSKFSGAGSTLPSGNVEFNFAGSSSKGGNASNTDAVGTQAAATVQSATVNFNGRNDRIATAVVAPVVANAAGTLDHVTNTDGSADISFEWTWGGTESQIDGFIVFVHDNGITTPTAQRVIDGAANASEMVFYVTAQRRAFILTGAAADHWYTFGVRAYRIVDPDINSAGVLNSAVVQPLTNASETTFGAYRPSANVAFAGNVTGTIDGDAASTVKSGATNGTTALNAVNNATTGLATKLSSNARTALTGSGGVAVGNLEWDANGVRTSGQGIGLTSNGLAAYNAAGDATFAISAATGNATFAGALSAATGSFTGAVYGGSYTSSYAWPTGGTPSVPKFGFHLSSSGLLLGNYNTLFGTAPNQYRRYFQIEANGDVYAPGFSIVNGSATFSGTLTANTVNTTNIVGAAVSSGYSTSGSSSATSISVTVAAPTGTSAVIILGYTGLPYITTAGSGKEIYSYTAIPAGTVKVQRTHDENGAAVTESVQTVTTQTQHVITSINGPTPGTYIVTLERDAASGTFNLAVVVNKR